MASHDDLIYIERVTSSRTEALFVVLALAFLLMFAWRMAVTALDLIAALLLLLALLFLFYAANYRALVVRLTAQVLTLTFGILSWTIPIHNIAECQLDALPALLRLGGAGIHSMLVRGRYRASLNFLEHPRVVISLRRGVGPVRDISFSTRRPEELLRILGACAAPWRAALPPDG